jgi:hypothetical protein
MPDQTNPVPTQTAFNNLIAEASDDVVLVKRIITAVKSKDRAALLSLIPEAAKEVTEDFTAVKTALPEIKQGYKTSEFWAVALVALANLYSAISGKPIPVDVNVIVGSLVGLYTIIRGMVKAKSAT